MITGIVKQQDNDALTVQTANEVVVVPRGEVEQIKVSQQSMMPDDLLKPLTAVRSPLAGRLPGQPRASAAAGHGR